MRRLLAAPVVAGLLAVAGCSDSDELSDLVQSAAQESSSSTTSAQVTTTTAGEAPTTTRADASTTTADGGGAEVSVFDLEVGDCFDTSEAAEVETVEVLACDTPHGNEVFALFDLEGDEFPGAGVVSRQAEEGCIERFEDYVGVEYAASALEVSFLYPLQEGWEQIGDREVVCIAFRDDGRDLDEPVEGSGL